MNISTRPLNSQWPLPKLSCYHTQLINKINQTVSHGTTITKVDSKQKTRMLTTYLVSIKAVPLTVIKGAGNEYIPIPAGESAIVADFHSYVSSHHHIENTSQHSLPAHAS
jgi:hypothetical protein